MLPPAHLELQLTPRSPQAWINKQWAAWKKDIDADFGIPLVSFKASKKSVRASGAPGDIGQVFDHYSCSTAALVLLLARWGKNLKDETARTKAELMLD